MRARMHQGRSENETKGEDSIESNPCPLGRGGCQSECVTICSRQSSSEVPLETEKHATLKAEGFYQDPCAHAAGSQS